MRIWISRGCILLFLLFLTVLSSELQNIAVKASPVLPSRGTLANYTPDEIVARAREWLKDPVPYNQHGYFQNLYREDCSGLVSMAWGISPSVNNGGLFTGNQPNNPNQQYALSSVAKLLGKALDESGKPIMSTMLQLQKGDLLLNQVEADVNQDYAHAILFVGWVDTQQKQIVSKPVIAKDGYYYYDGIEENGGIEKHADGTYSGYAIEHLPNYSVNTQPFDFHQPWPFPYYPGFDPGGYYAWRFDLAKALSLGYISQSGVTTPIASATATTKPSGEWMPPTPQDGAIITSDIILLAATAYPTHQKDPAITQVFFTIETNGNWRIVCSPTSPSKSGNVYTCNVNLRDLGVSYGQIRVSFDVYDQAGNVNLAPNGVHTLTYASLPKLVVNPASIDNLTLGNSDCTSTPISSTCLIVLSSPSSNQLNINWSATLAGPRSSLGSVRVTPSSGMLSPGQSVDVYLFVPDICGGPTIAPETITFTGGATPVVLQWTC